MNWVLMIVLAVIVLSAIFGYCKGLLKMVYSLVAWIIALAFVAWATPHINLYLTENTTIYQKVQAHCEETIRQSANERVQDKQEGTKEQFAELGINVPSAVLEGVLEKTGDATDAFLEESGIYAKLAEGLAGFVMKGISFAIALVMAWILVHIISRLIGIASELPVVKGANRMTGLAVGTVYGFLLVWLGFYGVALASAGDVGRVIVSYIYENPFLTFLYENNLVLTLILKYL